MKNLQINTSPIGAQEYNLGEKVGEDIYIYNQLLNYGITSIRFDNYVNSVAIEHGKRQYVNWLDGSKVEIEYPGGSSGETYFDTTRDLYLIKQNDYSFIDDGNNPDHRCIPISSLINKYGPYTYTSVGPYVSEYEIQGGNVPTLIGSLSDRYILLAQSTNFSSPISTLLNPDYLFPIAIFNLGREIISSIFISKSGWRQLIPTGLEFIGMGIDFVFD